MKSPITQYTLEDVGCYVDEARGIYAIDRIIEISEEHGMPAPEGCEDSDCERCANGAHEAGDGSYTEWSRCLYSGEVEDQATEYMNNCQGVDGACWGRSDNGDWGLWASDED